MKKGVGPRALGSPLKQTLTDKHGNKISKINKDKSINKDNPAGGGLDNISSVGRGNSFKLAKKPTSGVKIGPYEAFLSLSGDTRQEKPAFVAPRLNKEGKPLPYSAR